MDPTLIVTVIVTSVVTGLVSALGTVAALKVRVEWVHDTATRAHARIDEIEKRVGAIETPRRRAKERVE